MFCIAFIEISRLMKNGREISLLVKKSGDFLFFNSSVAPTTPEFLISQKMKISMPPYIALNNEIYDRK
jgi:hypothetical protein